jgi:hypothetical protein
VRRMKAVRTISEEKKGIGLPAALESKTGRAA